MYLFKNTRPLQKLPPESCFCSAKTKTPGLSFDPIEWRIRLPPHQLPGLFSSWEAPSRYFSKRTTEDLLYLSYFVCLIWWFIMWNRYFKTISLSFPKVSKSYIYILCSVSTQQPLNKHRCEPPNPTRSPELGIAGCFDGHSHRCEANG